MAKVSKEQIQAALRKMDVDNDDHWTTDGLPKMDVVNELVGTVITRAELTNAEPGFSRANTSIADDATPRNLGGTPGGATQPGKGADPHGEKTGKDGATTDAEVQARNDRDQAKGADEAEGRQMTDAEKDEAKRAADLKQKRDTAMERVRRSARNEESGDEELLDERQRSGHISREDVEISDEEFFSMEDELAQRQQDLEEGRKALAKFEAETMDLQAKVDKYTLIRSGHSHEVNMSEIQFYLSRQRERHAKAAGDDDLVAKEQRKRDRIIERSPLDSAMRRATHRGSERPKRPMASDIQQ